MSRRQLEFLNRHLARGPIDLGQIHITSELSVCHHDDVASSGLQVYRNPYDAVEIARYDPSGFYRPLKTAPNLKRGWRLELASLDDLLLALDFIYPAAIAKIIALQDGRLSAVPLRQTLARQTGMYAVTRNLTDDQSTTLTENFCRQGCLKQILWPLDGSKEPVSNQSASSTFTLWCSEACNLFVAASREIVKRPA